MNLTLNLDCYFSLGWSLLNAFSLISTKLVTNPLVALCSILFDLSIMKSTQSVALLIRNLDMEAFILLLEISLLVTFFLFLLITDLKLDLSSVG